MSRQTPSEIARELEKYAKHLLSEIERIHNQAFDMEREHQEVMEMVAKLRGEAAKVGVEITVI